MSDVPDSGTFNADDTLTQGELRQALEDVRNVIAEIAGSGDASGEQALTIATGVVTPAAGRSRFLRLSPEGLPGSTTDILDTIAQTNVPDQAFVFLRIADGSYVITVNHNAGGTGQISLAGGLDLELNQVEQVLLLRRTGTSYTEVARFGREKEHVVGSGGSEPAFSGSWTSPSSTLRFWKDENGIVHLSGEASNASSPVTDGSTIFTLPAGYRPAVQQSPPVTTIDGATKKITYIGISTAGVVTWNNVPAGNSTGALSLAVLTSFRATQ